MKKLILLFLSVSLLSWTQAFAVSAVRKPGEDWKQKFKSRNKTFDHQIQIFTESPMAQARRLSQIDFVSVPNVGNTENLMSIFRYLRDTRFIQNVASPKTARRISWKYPDDGCFIRAEVMATAAEARRWPSMKKLFAFGNLAVRTPNTQEGMARWWYHVAPVLRTGEVIWVLDPSVDYEKPLTVLQWKNAMAAEGEGVDGFALCDTHSFDPDDRCQQARAHDFKGVIDWQKQFLTQEWQRVLELGRDPYIEL